jgi:2-iminobutanoate/2-iminopropanoate deaminase
MPHTAITTHLAPAAIGPYSQAISAGPLLFISGQLGLDPASGELAPDFAGQARRALENLRHIVLAAGLPLEAVAAVDVFLTDMARFAEFNTLYAELFGHHRPARAVVAVSALPKAALVEIKAIAVRP